MGSPRAAACRGRLRPLAVLAVLVSALALVAVGGSSAATQRAKGIDVSNWNGAIKWSKVAAAGFSFAFGKATEGTTFIDGTYTTNRTGSEAAGLVFGAYHFARPSGRSVAGATASGIAQADYFLATAAPAAGELPPVLDLEKTGNLKPKLLVTWAQAWVDEIYARLGVEPLVYSSPAFWKTYLGDSPSIAASGALLWIAHWTSASQPWVPAQNWDGNGWTFWQWTNCLSVPGIAHCTDGDRMHGSDPSSVAIQPYPTDPPALATPPGIVGPPEAGKLLVALPGTWQGGKPLTFSYQWRRCDAAGSNCLPIAGATAQTYHPVQADVGHSLAAVVTATAASGPAKAATPPTVAVSPAGTPPSARPANITPPRILGTAQVGQVLTSSVGTWSGAPQTFAYRWQRCDATGADCLAIPHATGAQRTLTPDDIGSTLALVVTATGTGGAASASAAATDVVVAAPLPPVASGSQTVERGIAGNVETEDGRAVATWQPGAVPVGRTVSLNEFAGTLSVAGTEVSLDVPGLPASGFPWPVDIHYTQPQPSGTVLGYSTDGTVYRAVRALHPPQLPADRLVGSYLDTNGFTHVLTHTPLRVALFRRKAWGDPTFTAQGGPTLAQKTPLRVLWRRARHDVLVYTRLSSPEQTRLTVTITRAGGRRISILARGSRVGSFLQPGHAYHVVRAERDRPGGIRVRLRLNAYALRRGRYSLRISAIDPWGRTSTLTLPFRYR